MLRNQRMFLKPEGDKDEEAGETSGTWRQDRAPDDDTSIPTFFYQPNRSLSLEGQRQRLPIFRNRNHILYLLEKYQTLVLIGETGCGKSTQVPQYLYEAGWGNDGKMIGVTQPRRMAASSLATRVAEEKGCALGDTVGYAIRFDDCWTPGKTKVKFMTEGILIREMMSDPLLTQYCVILVDEVHERSLDTDILLGLLKKIARKRRENLRLVVASATVDAEELRQFFDDAEELSKKKRKKKEDDADDSHPKAPLATILSVEGRNFPVDVFYVKEPVPDYVKASIDTVLKIHMHERPGDVLVFLTGQEEVEHVVSILRNASTDLEDSKTGGRLMALPLYGALSPREQLKVFLRTPQGARKVVVTTNIAEASLTIIGIVYVVDCGFVKMRYFNPVTATDSLVVVPISKASAEQRAGRAGRMRSGKAFRLYPEEEFHNLAVSAPPEMQRTNLAFTILQLKALGIDNVLRFHFPSAPPAENVILALEVLYALGALDRQGTLTKPLGLHMAEFPMNPFFSKMLLSSADFGCSDEAIRICAMLQVQNPFIYPHGARAVDARKAKRLFAVAEGDLITMLNVFNAFEKNGMNRPWCQRNYLNHKILTRAVEVKRQLTRLLKRCKVPIVSADGDVDSVCRCITAGFFPNAAYLHHSGVYRTIRGTHELHIHQGSVLYTAEKQPSWVVFNEVVMTSMEYMTDITEVDPKWLCELAPHYYQFGTDREIAEREAINS